MTYRSIAGANREGESEVDRIDRRRFLGAVSAVGASWARSALAGSRRPRLTMPPNAERSRVVLARSSRVVADGNVHRILLGEMLESALTALTGTKTLREAWRTILQPDDIIGIKFNRSGQRIIGTSRATAEALITSLVASGWDAGQIVCLEAPADIERIHRTTPAMPGYADTPTDFGSGSDQLASALEQITALINLPFLKTHNIAGMTCAMKNLSHGLIKHPARYHANGCSPFVADIVALPEIRDKIRLCLVDGLRVVYDGGPEPSTGSISDEGVLLVSTDPVATDAVAVSLLNTLRKKFRLPPIVASPEDLGYLAAGHVRGVGVAVLHGIDLVRVFP